MWSFSLSHSSFIFFLSLSLCYIPNDNKDVDNDELVEIENKVNKNEDKEICYSLYTIHSYEQKCETKVSVDYVNRKFDENEKIFI